jgi:hypothetical protein
LIGQCLWGMAVVAAAQGQAARTVRLWAAAATLRYELTIPPSAVRPLEEHRLQSLREVLGSDAFGAEWASGQAMRRDDASSTILARMTCRCCAVGLRTSP